MSGESKLFVGQLSFDATVEDVKSLFEYYGEVLHVNIQYDRATNRSTGCAFVTYGSTEVADAAILALHNIYNMGRERPLQVSYCQRSRNISPFGVEHALRLANENRANPPPRLRPKAPPHQRVGPPPPQ